MPKKITPKKTVPKKISSHYTKSVKYLKKFVKIKDKKGNIYTGTIVKVDKKRVYLKVNSVKHAGKVHTSFIPFILPLVLFDLLAIVLLDTRRGWLF
ncbi:hypothetical protein M5X00_25505 [Paenibacillus alvei]|uniref:Uncharacterized protein n=1 Tax=Paenibacillus alvei TaxID=44250 RepID=A0AAP7A143_PAEAL|nr:MULTISPECIES: hypothetical protein [Paenibacillus]EJW14552.1 hypothetical protein PAV_12c00140 [Paenibacillus alvei DSM 29]MBG9732846.1 hypothetical protein [Paenibacillus alvei]MBG9745383.1 hypothetical protein [Paenibacillus alvei]MCY7486860.1 hypothetical protein [Paenibacillus alvei]MCY9542948.1 hypothetical protein [Paenibacillus alvei]